MWNRLETGKVQEIWKDDSELWDGERKSISGGEESSSVVVPHSEIFISANCAEHLVHFGGVRASRIWLADRMKREATT